MAGSDAFLTAMGAGSAMDAEDSADGGRGIKRLLTGRGVGLRKDAIRKDARVTRIKTINQKEHYP